MIVFDLQCSANHVFEAWFASSDDYAAQSARGLMACPICGDGDIRKAAMAPAVPAKGNRRRAAVPMVADSAPDSKGENPEAIKAALAMLAKFQRDVEANADYVGDGLPDAARAIHLGEAPARAIYGEATAAEAEALSDEGISLQRLPFRPRARGDA